jgi:HEAT repeat protein
MTQRKHHRLLWLLWPSLCLFFLIPAGTLHAQTLYEQCPGLKAPSDANDEVARQIVALKATEPQARAGAAAQLAKSCDQRAVAPLISGLRDADVGVRVAAVAALGQLGDRAAVDPLIEAISDPDWRVRLALTRALASFQVHPASYALLNRLVSPLEGKLGDEGDMRARCAGIIAIQQLKDVRFSAKALIFLFTFLADERPQLRQVAEQTALELKNTRNGAHELIAMLKQSRYPEHRRQAVYWIGKLGIQAGRPAVAEAAIGDRDERVRQTASAALEALKSSSQ